MEHSTYHVLKLSLFAERSLVLQVKLDRISHISPRIEVQFASDFHLTYNTLIIRHTEMRLKEPEMRCTQSINGLDQRPRRTCHRCCLPVTLDMGKTAQGRNPLEQIETHDLQGLL